MIEGSLSHYLILKKLGAGGMGEVYLAQDTRLDRTVALKVLSPDVASDPRRMRRFVREAKAASALNHPNILTIHEVGQAGSVHFIATEFVDGLTLRGRLARAPLKLGEALDVAVQVASALCAAHAANIVHRDIKPENIMLRADGYAKLLDFGLAKLTEPPESSADTETRVETVIKTEPGVVMGTPVYMSPEQARGLQLDGRTDIFSLGVVLYEMVAGRLPFAGETTGEVLASILGEREPEPLARYSRGVPSELERIISKALRKDREGRYQTVKDLHLDLKSLKQELEFAEKLERSQPPESSRAATGGEPQVETAEGTQPRPTLSVARATGANSRRTKVALVAASALLVALVAAAAYLYFLRSDKPAIDSIAILPFANVGVNPEAEYLSDGITESLINSFSQIPALRVMSRGSVFRFKGREAEARAVGRELGVSAVLSGRITQRGDGLVISVELVDARDNTHIWGEQYNRKLSDIFAVQEEITREISEKLRLRLTGEEERRVTKRYTDNLEAYQLYLKGRYHTERRTGEDIKKAIEYFNQAVAKDPNYALAYAGLADSYGPLAYHSFVHPKETQPRSQAAARKAVELDDSLPEAHATLAAALFFQNKDWEGAEREFLRAIKLNPNYSDPYTFYAHLLMAIGRGDEAVAAARRGLALDPLSPLKSAAVTRVLYFMRQYDEAIEQGRAAVEVSPDSWAARVWLGEACVQKGLYGEAIEQLQKAFPLSGDSPYVTGLLGHAYAASGDRGQAVKILNELKAASKQRYVSAYHVALIHAGLGEKEQALDWLEKAFEERNEPMVYIKVDPKLDALHSEPRFQEVLRRMRLAP